jgi:thiamine transport system substrate-binding protein
VLRGTENEDGARQLVDFMLSRRFQEDVPLSMFVYPVVRGVRLPPEFRKFAVVPSNPLDLPPEQIEANRERWVKEWTAVVLR